MVTTWKTSHRLQKFYHDEFKTQFYNSTTKGGLEGGGYQRQRCRKQQQLANKERKVFDKANRELGKMMTALGLRGREKVRWNLINKKHCNTKQHTLHNNLNFDFDIPYKAPLSGTITHKCLYNMKVMMEKWKGRL